MMLFVPNGSAQALDAARKQAALRAEENVALAARVANLEIALAAEGADKRSVAAAVAGAARGRQQAQQDQAGAEAAEAEAAAARRAADAAEAEVSLLRSKVRCIHHDATPCLPFPPSPHQPRLPPHTTPLMCVTA